jgi:hypothetical protein
MATVTQVELTCDVCGNAKDVKTWTFGLDGKAYEIDLCRKDGNALGRVTAGYISKARKVPARPDRRPGQQQHGGRLRSRTAAAASDDGARAPERSSRPRPQNVEAASAPAAGSADGRQHRGIFVYGVLPADIEVAAGTPGVGEHPGLLRDVRFGDLAALVSEVDLSGRLGSPGDLRAHREILDATAAEVPVLPMRFGTVLPSEDAVAEELLAAHRDEFTAALEQLEGRAEFLVKGCYVEDAVLDEVCSQNTQAARLRDVIHGGDADAARTARSELGQLINEAVTARREEDTRTLRQAMEGLCVASVVREPAHELDAVYVAFLVAVDEERDVERVIEDLAREWEGRIDIQLLGPMAAYDFTGTAPTET